MATTILRERRFLAADEFDRVRRTHYPAIRALSPAEVGDLRRQIRDMRDKARDTARRQRREMRGKQEARGARPAGDHTGTSIKAELFAGALKRLNRIATRHRAAESQVEIAQRALRLKQAGTSRHHPGAGRTADGGMTPVPSREPTVTADPREVGRVSQFVRDAQAQRDSR